MDRSTLSPRSRQAGATTSANYISGRSDGRPSLSRSSSSSTPSIAVSEYVSQSPGGFAPPYNPDTPQEQVTVTTVTSETPVGENGVVSGATTPITSSYSTGVFDSDSDAISVHSVSSSANASSNLTPGGPSGFSPSGGQSPNGGQSQLGAPVGPLITIGEIIKDSRKVSIDHNASVETAFDLLTKHGLNCVPISQQGHIFDSFDYADLTGYLLLILGQITVKGEHTPEFQRLLTKARNGIPAPVGFAAQFGGGRDPFSRMSADTPVSAAFDRFARGVHRLAVTQSQSGEVTGLLSQRQLVRYVWEHPKRFPGLEWALDQTIEELQAGTYGEVVSISGEEPLLNAFDLMHERAVSSVAVVDNSFNLLGNISVIDVGLVTRAWQAGLLHEPCKQFLTVILDHRSLQEGGNESVPVFFVDKTTKLAKVVAMMVSTGAHRLWICEPSSDPAHSGKLVGVISMTDVLNVIARLAGQSLDPDAARRNRRSSSSSVRSQSSRHSLLQGSRPRLSFNRERPPMP